MSANMLTDLDEDTFKHGGGIERLLLTSNWLANIHPRALTPLTSLQHLDLSDNYLERLMPAVLRPVERSLVTLSLAANPWNCACEVRELWTWLQDHLSRVPDPSALLCAQPKVCGGPFFVLFRFSCCPFLPLPVFSLSLLFF